MNTGEIIAAAAARASVPTTDRLYATGRALLNVALGEVTSFSPQGWEYLRRSVDLTTVADQADYPFVSSLMPLVADNAALSERYYPVTRVQTAVLVAASGITQPLQRVSKLEIEQLVTSSEAATTTGPWYFTAEGRTLTFAPTPSSEVTVRCRVLIGERELGDDDESPLLPAEYHYALVDLLRSYFYDAKQDDERAAAARIRFEAGMRAALYHSRETGGAGRVPLEQT